MASRLVARVPIAAAIVCLVLLGLRTLSTVDLGYHLDYGERFLATGAPVDHDEFLYTLPPPGLAAESRPEPGPGCWYDGRGRYRFANANWLSQAVMASVFTVGGWIGLCVLGAALVTATAILMLTTMRRLGVPPPLAAAGLILYGVAAAPRLNLRPELFGYLVLAAQACVLAGIARGESRGRTIGVGSIAALVGLQLLFVNFHSYFPLGLALVGAVFIDHAARRPGRRRGGAARMGAATAAMALVSLVNPWTWRLALLPVETFLYMRRHGISEGPGPHPWSHVLEFRPTFSETFPDKLSEYAIAGVAVLAAAAILLAIRRRRLADLLTLSGMLFVMTTMIRNVAPAAIVLIPLALACLCGGGERMRKRLPAAAGIASGAVVLLLCALFASAIVSNRLYRYEGQRMRFGVGPARAYLPVGASAWLDESLPGARVWCDMSSCSTVRFFTRPHREVPIVSNAYAAPPSVMVESRNIRAGRDPFGAFERYHVGAVVIRYDRSLPLFRALVDHPQWRLVQAEGLFATFARLRGDSRDRAIAEAPLVAERIDVDRFVDEQRRVDPFPESSLVPVGLILLNAGRTELSIALLEAAVADDPDLAAAWEFLGEARLERARRQPDDPAADLAEAERCFQRALDLDPDNARAADFLSK